MCLRAMHDLPAGERLRSLRWRQTVMQPVTSYVRRPVMVPYTSYRPVVTSMNYATPACTTCGASYSSPYYTGLLCPRAADARLGGGGAAGDIYPTDDGHGTRGRCGSCDEQYVAICPALMHRAGNSMHRNSMLARRRMQAKLIRASRRCRGLRWDRLECRLPQSHRPPTMGSPVDDGTFDGFADACSERHFSAEYFPAKQHVAAASLMPTTPIPDNSGSAPRLLDPQSRTTSAEIIGPASVTHAVFNTADRGSVFHAIGYVPASKSTSESSNDGWSAGSTTTTTGNRATASKK